MAFRKVIIGADDAGQRLDTFLRKIFHNLPVSVLYKWVRTKKIKVNGSRAAFNTVLMEHDSLDFHVPARDLAAVERKQVSTSVVPLPPIIYEDDQLIVLDKPAGLAVHGGSGIADDTLTARVHAYIHRKPDRPASLSYCPAPVHRLDRQTSGVIVYGLVRQAHVIMCRQIKERLWKKHYVALVHGAISPPAGSIDFPLERKSEKQGRVFETALTNYRVLDQTAVASLVEIELLTGRFRQIRRHFVQKGHPLFGETRYVSAGSPDRGRGERLFLHACKLEFVHPSTQRTMVFKADLPLELQHMLEAHGLAFVMD